MIPDLLSFSCSLYQSKIFVKLSYHALEACFNPGLSLVFLPISVSVVKVVGTEGFISLFRSVSIATKVAIVVFYNWFSDSSVRQTTSSFLDTSLRNSLSPVKCLEQPLAKWQELVETVFKEVKQHNNLNLIF